MDKIELKILETEYIIEKTFNLSKGLNPHIIEEDYEVNIQNMIENGFSMLGIFSNSTIIGICGYWINTKLYSGKYLEIDNFIIQKEYQSLGIGKLVVDWMKEKALIENCKCMMLDSYIVNEESHKFYERNGFVKKGFHFLLNLH